MDLRHTALLVVDMQRGFDDPYWGPRNNPGLETTVATLLAAWRAAGGRVVHVHHASNAGGCFRPGSPGHRVKPEAMPRAGEPVYRKRVNSAFIGTTLAADLRASEVGAVAIVGLTTNHCISTTARMAANLGFDTLVVADATAAFDGRYLNDDRRPARQVHEGALSDLQGEFARIIDSDWLLDALRLRDMADAG